MFDYGKSLGIKVFSTPFDSTAVDFLEKFKVPAFKIASTDTNNIPFIKYLSKIGKPIILSTAMSTLDEVERSVKLIKKFNKNFVVMQCTGNYPASLEDSNLLVLNTYKNTFDCLVGYSDHTLDNINPIAATALGASIYEKHFTVDKNLDGPDHRMSLNPKELQYTIKIIRETDNALGTDKKFILENEKENRIKLRKSLVAEIDIKAGDIITYKMIGIKRPGGGILPEEIDKIVGRKARNNICKDSLIKYEMFDD